MNQQGYRVLLHALAPDPDTGKQWLIDMLDAGYDVRTGSVLFASATGVSVECYCDHAVVAWQYSSRLGGPVGAFSSPVAAHVASVLAGVHGPVPPQEPTQQIAAAMGTIASVTPGGQCYADWPAR